MAKYTIMPNGDSWKHLKEIHITAKDGYHRVVFENGCAETDNPAVAKVLGGRFHGTYEMNGEVKKSPLFSVWKNEN